MSANNLLYIKQTKKGFDLSMRDADTGSQLGKKEKFNLLTDAILKANKIQDAEIVEYGLQIDLLKG